MIYTANQFLSHHFIKLTFSVFLNRVRFVFQDNIHVFENFIYNIFSCIYFLSNPNPFNLVLAALQGPMPHVLALCKYVFPLWLSMTFYKMTNAPLQFWAFLPW